MKNKKSRKALLSAGIFFGLAAVASVTFAAYVITGGVHSDDLTVGPGTIDVEDRSINVEADWDSNNNTLSFDASDKEGDIRYEGDAQAPNYGEDLTVVMNITATFSEQSVWTGIKITPSATGVGNAVDAHYINMPAEQTIERATFETGVAHPVTLTFAWGTEFGGNPSKTLEGKPDAYDKLTAFKTALAATTFKFHVEVVTGAGE